MALATCLLIFSVAVTLAALRLRSASYARFFSYDRRASCRYDFPPEAAGATGIELRPSSMSWPELPDAADTALLELELHTTWRGRLADPWIELQAGENSVRQSFERGARGVRYVNVSALLRSTPAGAVVHLRGAGVTWAVRARLLSFANAMRVQSRGIVVAPHPDDAEIAAFGLYHDTDSWVVTITAGERGSFYDGRLAAGDPIGAAASGKLRVWDSITIPRIGGVPPDRAMNLAYPDGQLAALHEGEVPAAEFAALRGLNLSPLVRPRVGGPTWRALVEDLTHLLREIRPEWLATPHPLLDDHPDHAFTTLAICEALAATKLDGRLLLYVTHSPCSSLYPFGPAGHSFGPPPHFGELAGLRGVYSHPLTPEAQRLKVLALAAHHDLRPVPDAGPISWARIVRGALAEARGKITGLGRDPTSFFRRAARPHELFFVLPYADAAPLAARFLAQWRAGEYRAHTFR